MATNSVRVWTSGGRTRTTKKRKSKRRQIRKASVFEVMLPALRIPRELKTAVPYDNILLDSISKSLATRFFI